MNKTTRLLIGIPVCFTVLVVWFAWSALHAAPPLAAENLRGAGLSILAAIEKLATADSSLHSLTRYTTPDIAYFTLVDSQGVIRFHTNPGLIGQSIDSSAQQMIPPGISEEREELGTGEEVYLFRTTIRPDQNEYLLTLAMHTYRADNVIRQAKTGVMIASILTISLWGLTAVLFFMLRREERHHREMRRREEFARLGEMGAVMAHEIRNPLAGIKGFAQLVQISDSLEKSHEYAEIIVSQSQRMEALVSDLLAFTREDRAERESVNLATLVDGCVAMINIEAAPAQVQVEYNVHHPLTCRVVADRITQLLLNLMKNSVQAMPDGGLLQINLKRSDKMARITVADSGIGIEPAHLPHIFEPFWTSKVQGTGLGLALCRKVAEEHGGNLKVESTAGVGTIVTLTLPLASS